MFSRSLFKKKAFEIWGCSFVSDLKLRSTSSAEKNFADEITWITWKTEQNLEIWLCFNSRLEMWVWESGRKIDPATGVKRCRWFQIIDMLNNRQIPLNRNCSTLAIPWCFYKISRTFDGFSTSIIWQKYHPPELKQVPIFPLLKLIRTGFNVIILHRCRWFNQSQNYLDR